MIIIIYYYLKKKGAIQRMRQLKLSMAFEKWQYTAAQLARQQYMLAGKEIPLFFCFFSVRHGCLVGAAKRMLKRQLSMAFEKW